MQLYVRPRVYDPGDTSYEVNGITSELVPVSQAFRFGQMTITIPAAQFGTKSWWYLVIQRDTIGPTYPDEVVITTVAIGYTALSPFTSIALPVVSRQQ